MLMTMQHEFGAVLSQYCDECVAIDQPAVAPFRLGLRRMMDQHDAELVGMLVEESGKPRKLRSAKPSSSAERQCGNCSRHSDQGEEPAFAHEWKPRRRVGRHGVATHI